jgi:hypothetical protein
MVDPPASGSKVPLGSLLWREPASSAKMQQMNLRPPCLLGAGGRLHHSIPANVVHDHDPAHRLLTNRWWRYCRMLAWPSEACLSARVGDDPKSVLDTYERLLKRSDEVVADRRHACSSVNASFSGRQVGQEPDLGRRLLTECQRLSLVRAGHVVLRLLGVVAPSGASCPAESFLVKRRAGRTSGMTGE